MTPLAALIRDEILHTGPMIFERFMELALYHPAYGYYRRGRDPFGRRGDYYTASQLQPVFGLLMAARIRALFEETGRPEDCMVIELGAGRGEMEPALAEFAYRGVDLDRGSLPERFCGVVLANEFFDALPVAVVVRRQGELRLMRVGWCGERCVWVEAERVDPPTAAYLQRYHPSLEEGGRAEVNLRALAWIEQLARRLERGYLLVIDYGYTTRESARFPAGTLMSYRRHAALEDVLADPGEQDITAHLGFSALEEHAAACGFRRVRFESLAQTLLAAGARDAFASVLTADTEPERLRRRLQLKTLLAGMGETFRTLLLAKDRPEMNKAPHARGPK